MGGGLAIGYLTAPGEWYALLAKPPFNPPGWIFGPVWTVLYVLIAVARAGTPADMGDGFSASGHLLSKALRYPRKRGNSRFS